MVTTLVDTPGIIAATFSPDAKYVVATGSTVKIWETASAKLVTDLNVEHYHSVFSPDGKYLATTDGNSAKVWEVRTGKMLISVGRYFEVGLNPFSPDSKYVVTVAANNNSAIVWEIASRRLYKELSDAHDVGAAVFSPDGKFLVTTSNNHTTADYSTKIWDFDTGKLLRSLKHQGSVLSAIISPQGQFILTTSIDYASDVNHRRITVWEFATGKPAWEFKSKFTDKAIFSPDGNYIVAGRNEAWRTSTGESLSSLIGSKLYSYTFSGNGRYVAATSVDGTDEGFSVTVYESATGKVVSNLRGHKKFVSLITFSPDEKYVITSQYNNTAKIWKTNGGHFVKDLTGPVDEVTYASFSQDGKYLITFSGAPEAKLWQLAGKSKIRHDQQLGENTSSFDVNSSNEFFVQMEEENGVYKIPCKINGLALSFVIDTGASDISISLTEALFMLKNGYLLAEDVHGTERYRIANGQIAEGTKIILRSISIGQFEINDVEATVLHNINSPLLFGSSALQRFGKIEIDYSQKTIKLGR